jgi:hypothetical protein
MNRSVALTKKFVKPHKKTKNKQNNVKTPLQRLTKAIANAGKFPARAAGLEDRAAPTTGDLNHRVVVAAALCSAGAAQRS